MTRWLPAGQALTGKIACDMCPCCYRNCSELPTARREFEEDESFKEALPTNRLAMVVEPDHEHMLRVEALIQASARAS